MKPDDLAPQLREINFSNEDLPSQRALGICWNAETDSTSLKEHSSTSVHGVLTRRKALSFVNSQFDPLGLWSPCFVNLKLCYSKIVANTAGWDDEVTEELCNEWNEYLSEIQSVTSLAFARQYLTLSSGTHELHLFCDATDQVMGACVYLEKCMELSARALW